MSIAQIPIPTACHVGDDDLPWAEAGAGIRLKVLQVRQEEGLWVIRNQFGPGTEVQTHRHTGQVFGYTLSGAWKYAEYPDINRTGSFLFEPAGSEHTLTVLDDNTGPTDVWFQIYGANLNLDADGNVESITDARGIYDAYMMLCEAQGLGRPDVLI